MRAVLGGKHALVELAGLLPAAEGGGVGAAHAGGGGRHTVLHRAGDREARHVRGIPRVHAPSTCASKRGVLCAPRSAPARTGCWTTPQSRQTSPRAQPIATVQLKRSVGAPAVHDSGAADGTHNRGGWEARQHPSELTRNHARHGLGQRRRQPRGPVALREEGLELRSHGAEQQGAESISLLRSGDGRSRRKQHAI